MIRFVIPGKLGGFNQYVDACRTNPHAGDKYKKNNEIIVVLSIRKQISGLTAKAPVDIKFAWYEKDNRRDPDNISGFGHKVILDALVSCGIIKDDSRKYIASLADEFYTDRKNPRIEVTISERA